MTDNDILAEYVRKTRPEIESSLGFVFYKITARVGEAINSFTETFRNIPAEELEKALGEADEQDMDKLLEDAGWE